MATTYRDAEVYGVDLVNCPLADPPDNATFTVRDVLYGFEDEDDTYDVVHVRDIAMGIRDYPALLTECIRVLKPGGYLVLLELEWMADFLDPDKSAADACPELYNYMQTVHRAVNERGLDPLLGYNFEFYTDMIAHLVSDRTTDRYFVPIAPGHPDPTLNHLGELSVRTWELFAQSSRLLMRDHGECDAEALSEASLKEFTGEEGLYWFFDVCVARKA